MTDTPATQDEDNEYRLDITDPVAVNNALEVYFNVTPYKIEYGVDFTGNQVTKKVANDVPHLDGFCALHGISMEELESVIYPRVASICFSKFKHVMVINGLHGLYETGPWGLTMKNLARWADKSESRVTTDAGEIEPEKLERALQFLLEKQRREMPSKPGGIMAAVVEDARVINSIVTEVSHE